MQFNEKKNQCTNFAKRKINIQQILIQKSASKKLNEQKFTRQVP